MFDPVVVVVVFLVYTRIINIIFKQGMPNEQRKAAATFPLELFYPARLPVHITQHKTESE